MLLWLIFILYRLSIWITLYISLQNILLGITNGNLTLLIGISFLLLSIWVFESSVGAFNLTSFYFIEIRSRIKMCTFYSSTKMAIRCKFLNPIRFRNFGIRIILLFRHTLLYKNPLIFLRREFCFYSIPSLWMFLYNPQAQIHYLRWRMFICLFHLWT